MPSSQNASRTSSFAIWILAGVIALVAVSIGLLNQPKDDTFIQEPVRTVVKSTQAPRLDVVFVIDATGSMSDEIDMVKKEIQNIAQRLAQGTPKPDIRYGLVFYQDRHGSSFLTRNTPLSRDVQNIHRELAEIQAGGGGDWREHVGRGLHDALYMQWDMSPGVARSIYLAGDAPSHDDYKDGHSIESAIQLAQQKNIVIHAIGCSGLNAGRSEFKNLAQQTNGTYTDLTYQSVVADDTGRQRSVLYHNGTYYEADEVLKKDDWGRGADKLLEEKRLRTARPAMKSKAAAAPSVNNIGTIVEGETRNAVEDLGVEFK